MNPEFYNFSNFNDFTDEIVSNVVTNKCKNIKQLFTLHGEKTETKKNLTKYLNDFTESEMYTLAGTTIIITGCMDNSYCLYGLNRNNVVFKNKVKNIMIRSCNDTRIHLNEGTIAGIDILFGCNVSLRTPKHNFTNVEQSNHTFLSGTVDSDTLIHITQSMDVFVNHKNLRVNPFVTEPLKLVYQANQQNERIDIGEMSKSPIADSCDERWKTKLMIMGNDLSNNVE